jgi:hypothetical protein
MRIRSTSKGRRLLQKGRELRITYLASRLESLAPEEQAKLAEAGEILKRLLDDWR